MYIFTYIVCVLKHGHPTGIRLSRRPTVSIIITHPEVITTWSYYVGREFFKVNRVGTYVSEIRSFILLFIIIFTNNKISYNNRIITGRTRGNLSRQPKTCKLYVINVKC